MLLSEVANVIWNSKNKKYYTERGYEFTGVKTAFTAKVTDLTDYCYSIVDVQCDYCGKQYQTPWYRYKRAVKQSIVCKDACPECYQKKSQDSITTKYGGYTELQESCADKRQATNLQKYGSSNVFGNIDIQQKIINTNLKKYGVKYTQQAAEVRTKTERTCTERYGVKNYVELFAGKFIKDNSPTWKGGVEASRHERATYEYTQWRKSVFGRDGYECQCCHAKNGRGYYVELQAHHIYNWKDHPEVRYDIDNGITLCLECHTRFHILYGKTDTNAIQLKEFLKSDEKIC